MSTLHSSIIASDLKSYLFTSLILMAILLSTLSQLAIDGMGIVLSSSLALLHPLVI
jgi:hypothetical protein